MKKIIISSITLFFLFPIMSANALGKRSSSSSQSQCPSAVTEGTAVASHCSTHTITCPRVALKDSSLDQRCRASGVTTLCNRYDSAPPPACVYISQPDRPNLEPEIRYPAEGISKDVYKNGGWDGINLAGWSGVRPSNNCHISNGEKRCTSCSDITSEDMGMDAVTGKTTSTRETCSTCTTTTEPLVPKKACNNNEDCLLVEGGGCCDDTAIHKSQKRDYFIQLEQEQSHLARERRNRERETGTRSLSSCSCPAMVQEAYCVGEDAEVNGPTPQKFCQVRRGGSYNPSPVLIPRGSSGSLQ